MCKRTTGESVPPRPARDLPQHLAAPVTRHAGTSAGRLARGAVQGDAAAPAAAAAGRGRAPADGSDVAGGVARAAAGRPWDEARRAEVAQAHGAGQQIL